MKLLLNCKNRVTTLCQSIPYEYFIHIFVFLYRFCFVFFSFVVVVVFCFLFVFFFVLLLLLFSVFFLFLFVCFFCLFLKYLDVKKHRTLLTQKKSIVRIAIVLPFAKIKCYSLTSPFSLHRAQLVRSGVMRSNTDMPQYIHKCLFITQVTEE